MNCPPLSVFGIMLCSYFRPVCVDVKKCTVINLTHDITLILHGADFQLLIQVYLNSMFCYLHGSDSIEAAIEKYGVQRASLLRAFCQRVGIQILLREYNLECRNRAIFNEDDIVNVFPIVKHIQPRVCALVDLNFTFFAFCKFETMCSLKKVNWDSYNFTGFIGVTFKTCK